MINSLGAAEECCMATTNQRCENTVINLKSLNASQWGWAGRIVYLLIHTEGLAGFL